MSDYVFPDLELLPNVYLSLEELEMAIKGLEELPSFPDTAQGHSLEAIVSDALEKLRKVYDEEQKEVSDEV